MHLQYFEPEQPPKQEHNEQVRQIAAVPAKQQQQQVVETIPAAQQVDQTSAIDAVLLQAQALRTRMESFLQENTALPKLVAEPIQVHARDDNYESDTEYVSDI